MSRYVVSLSSKRALREACAGGKGASLAWLSRNGFNVPSGFVITSAAFRDFLASRGIEMPTQRGDWTQDELERMRELVTTSNLPNHLARPIAKAYRKLDEPVAIRSSMVGEDASACSFAGQLDTTLKVRTERDVLRAVKRCWASVFNWRTFKYLNQCEALGVSTAAQLFSMAVVVQKMVDAEAAGVAFSADPLTGQRCVVIEAARGLGDVVVSGLIQPDRYVVDARGVLAETALAGAEAPALADQQILRLAEVVRDIARKLEAPQDIEWAWDGADFYILQSRPITSLAGQRVYSNKMVSDMSPGLIKPLVYSTKIVAMAENVFGRIFTELIGPNDVDFRLLVNRVHSRIYTDITMLGELFEQVGLPANFFEMMSRDEQADFRRPPLTLRTLRAMLRLFRFVWRHSRIADKIEAFIERHNRELERYREADWTDADLQDLLAEFDQLMRLHGELQWHIFIGPINMMVRNKLLNKLVERQVGDVAPSDLIRGLVGLKALEPNDELRNLAAQARALGDEIQRLMIEEDDKTIREILSISEEGQALVRSVDAFLNRYGFLSPNGTDFAATPWIESPTLIWHAAGRHAAKPTEPVIDDVEAKREEARRRVRSHLSRLHRTLFDRLLASTITYIDLRERTSLLMSEDSYQMRRIFLALADRLVARGDLEQRDDIFYLMYPEIRNLVEGELAADVVREFVNTRRAEMEADAQIELPDTIFGTRVPTRPILPADGQEYLVGISGSSGVAQGYARIILDPAKAPVTLTRNDILVVPFTDVGWTPLFPGIGGIVAETGGQLSHTSIVAREYGLPAVVSVKQATRLVKDGQPITVDGDSGRVYLRHVMNSRKEAVK